MVMGKPAVLKVAVGSLVGRTVEVPKVEGATGLAAMVVAAMVGVKVAAAKVVVAVMPAVAGLLAVAAVVEEEEDHLAVAVPVAVVAVGAAPWGLGLSAATEAGMAVATEAGTVVGSVVVMVVVMEVGMQVVGLAGEVMEEAAPVVGVPVVVTMVEVRLVVGSVEEQRAVVATAPG